MIRKFLVVLALPLLLTPLAAWSSDKPLTEGAYKASLSPNSNAATSRRIENEVSKIDGVSGVNEDMQKSTLAFTINPGSEVKASEIEHAVQVVDSNVTMGTPQPLGTVSK